MQEDERAAPPRPFERVQCDVGSRSVVGRQVRRSQPRHLGPGLAARFRDRLVIGRQKNTAHETRLPRGAHGARHQGLSEEIAHVLPRHPLGSTAGHDQGEDGRRAPARSRLAPSSVCYGGAMNHAFIIAEAGVNHNGSVSLARALVDAAKEAGADAVKFQTFRAESLAVASAPKAAYQERTTGTDEGQRAMREKLELSEQALREVSEHCRNVGVTMMSSPFDVESVTLLASLGVPMLKIGSGEITHARLLRAAAQTGLPVVLSTGMSTLGEIGDALAELAHGYAEHRAGGPGRAPPPQVDRAHGLLHGRVTILQCVTQYPAPYADANLRAMESLRHAFGLPVGYSDHTLDIFVPLAAVALGAVMIEKHLTTDRSLPGPDHGASLEPAELTRMVRGIRAVEQALGDGRKYPLAAELPNREIARRALVARRPIAEGEAFTLDNMVAKRPARGVSPMRDAEYLGRLATRAYATDEPIDR